MNNSRIIFILVFFLPFMILSCKKDMRLEAQKASDDILNHIAWGSAQHDFPKKYFDSTQGLALQTFLRNTCDFKERQGQFINDFYQKNVNGPDHISCIYEYYLKCDSLRFIFTYDVGESLKLTGFFVEPIQVNNPMILKQERRLKF